MKQHALIVIAALTMHSPVLAAGEPDIFYPHQFETKKGPIPACAPLYVETSCAATKRAKPDHAYSLRDRAMRWKPVFMTGEALKDLKSFPTFAECVRAAPDFDGLYTEEQLAALSRGELIAGMPLSFAIAILGAPDSSSYTSMLDPTTRKSVSLTTYLWDRAEDTMSAAAAFGIIGGLALGVAAGSHHVDTAIRAARVGTMAESAGSVLISAEMLKGAHFVTVQADEKQRITMVTVR